MGLKCAGKKIHKLLLEQGDAYASYTVCRFEEECRLLSQVHHPNIVQFLGVYFQQGVRAPILVMEFLTPNMTAKISDLGVAKILDLTSLQVNRMTQTPGTPAYMP